LERHQAHSAAQVLGRAFYDDPLYMYLLPNDRSRAAQSAWFFQALIRVGLHLGQVHTTPPVGGAAIWLAPGKTDVNLWTTIRAGLPLVPLKFGLGGFRRTMNMLNSFEESVHEADLGRHWYLMLLGIDPQQQGRGLGGALMLPMLDRADSDNLPCYLETCKKRNVAFYERYGFRVIFERHIPGGGPIYWGMVRQPKS